ncbi:Fic/DOC family protein [Microbulbifer sp. JMSA003]|uniref:Fic/DOC family protein n=1 Tax=Microbulbifer sp. JMSA003 TaxID=3243369 RepID=UPI004039F8E4
MTLDKYGTGNDPYCYHDSDVLINLLNIEDDEELAEVEARLTELAVEEIEFNPPPYKFEYFKAIHRQLFEDVYGWAGELRTIDISKGDTRFCTCSRVTAEANKLFQKLADADYYENHNRNTLVSEIAEFYIELNMIHPFREGNGRAQRILFEHIIINTSHEFNLESITRHEWIAANIAGVNCNYAPMSALFDRCIGPKLSETSI